MVSNGQFGGCFFSTNFSHVAFCNATLHRLLKRKRALLESNPPGILRAADKNVVQWAVPLVQPIDIFRGLHASKNSSINFIFRF
jgi:hypothetical protein